jgi:hypothetical protein
MEVKKRLRDLPEVEEDPRFLQLIKDYKCIISKLSLTQNFLS